MAKRKLRGCSSCKICCEALPIGGSVAGVFCEQINVMGCSIYPRRPPECKDFDCLWVLDRHPSVPLMKETERPDLLGVMYVLESEDAVQPVEVKPGALKKARTTTRRLGKRMRVL